MTRRQSAPPSGFMNHDYVLTFAIADEENARKLATLCAEAWQGDAITPHTWEISNDLTPDQLENELLPLLGEDDRAVYYYLSDTKRIFRVVIS